jgi:2-methylcitrate dehydratase
LHPEVKNRLKDIKKVAIRTQASAMEIISKTGKLRNPADRDHCIQYMIAIGLIHGKLTAADFEDKRAKNPAIDKLRKKMVIKEDKKFSRDYLNARKRSISNAIQVFFNDGTKTKEIVVEYPHGHPFRREEGFPLLEEKFEKNMLSVFSKAKTKKICNLFKNQKKLEKMRVSHFMKLLVKTRRK